jgi:hypothetical protein
MLAKELPLLSVMNYRGMGCSKGLPIVAETTVLVWGNAIPGMGER